MSNVCALSWYGEGGDPMKKSRIKQRAQVSCRYIA
jgi:hypothetical protein